MDEFVNSSLSRDESYLATLDDYPNDSTLAQRAEEQRLGERLLDDTLNQPRHGPGAERAIEAFCGQPGSRFRGQVDGDLGTRQVDVFHRSDGLGGVDGSTLHGLAGGLRLVGRWGVGHGA